MPSLDESLALYATKVAGRDSSWKQEGLCRNQGEKARQWTVGEGDTVTIAGLTFKGIDAQRRAAMVCFNCPVQWECARWAVEVDEPAGVWSMITRDMTWLQRQKNPLGIIDRARMNEMPVQEAVRRIRNGVVE